MPYKDIEKRRACQRRYANRCYWADPEKYRKASRAWAAANPEKLRAVHTAPKREFIAEFGGACQCCGEHRYEFLTCEHLNGRKSHEKGVNGHEMYRIARNEGYPRDKYALLCANCNLAKGLFGVCPHERERAASAPESTTCSEQQIQPSN